jgi:phosphoribosylglycinamide formyltransferase-1
VDTGPIVLQEVVPVMTEDTVESLSARILEREHGLYVDALNLVMSGNYRLEGRSVLPLGDRT